MKRIAVLLILSLFAQALAAEEDDASNDLTLLISTLPEAKLMYTKHFNFPFLQGESPLTEGNNIDLALRGEITPVSLNGIAGAVLTPIAFFEFSAGAEIGSGWNINLFGGDIYGIGINRPDDKGNAVNDGQPFDGMFWKLRAGGALQMDLAAVFPGDWNHVVARSYHEFNYKAYTHAKEHESWYFEADDGENCNGFNYYGNLLIGYQMPIFLDTVAFLVEGDLYLYDTPDRGRWGDDLLRWTFSNVLSFTITKQFGITLITQLRTRRTFQEGRQDAGDVKDVYYRNRNLNKSGPRHLTFYRVAAAFTYKF